MHVKKITAGMNDEIKMMRTNGRNYLLTQQSKKPEYETTVTQLKYNTTEGVKRLLGLAKQLETGAEESRATRAQTALERAAEIVLRHQIEKKVGLLLFVAYMHFQDRPTRFKRLFANRRRSSHSRPTSQRSINELREDDEQTTASSLKI